MDIALVRSANQNDDDSFAFDATGGNLLVFLGTGLSNAGSPDSFSSLTYDSVALTRAVYNNPYRPGAEVWYLLDPNTGNNTLALTTGWASRYTTVLLFSGAHVVTPLVNTESTTGSPLNSHTLSSLTDTPGDVAVQAVSGDYGGDVNYTWATGQTELYDAYSGVHDHNGGTSYALHAETTASAMAFAGGSGQSTTVGAVFAPPDSFVAGRDSGVVVF